jgi:hypothetical protein
MKTTGEDKPPRRDCGSKKRRVILVLALLAALTALYFRKPISDRLVERAVIANDGEIIEVFLQDKGLNQTQLWIVSHYTFIGGAWQADRRNDVIWALKKVMEFKRIQ